jgi:hypothetical protein
MYMTVGQVVLAFGMTLLMCEGSGMFAMRKLRSADPADAF